MIDSPAYVSDPWLDNTCITKAFKATLKMWYSSFPEEERFEFELWALERQTTLIFPLYYAFYEQKSPGEFMKENPNFPA